MNSYPEHSIIEFIGVYDADSTLVGEISYWIGARLGRTHCSLCEITHGFFTIKSEWKQCQLSLDIPFRTFHRNDAPLDVIECAQDMFPIVLARTSVGLSVVLHHHELDELNGSVSHFVDKLNEFQMPK